MKQIAGQLVLWSTLVSSVSCLPAASQGTSRIVRENSGPDSAKRTRVALASNSGPPGSVVIIPIYFTPAAGVEVGRLKLTVNFVSASVKFGKLERGIAAQVPDLEFRSEIQFGKNEKGLETSTLTVVAGFSSPEPPKKGIPGGILGYLNLRIIEQAPAALISLRTTAEGAELGSNKPLTDIESPAAHLEIAWVDAPPNVTCFFFAH